MGFGVQGLGFRVQGLALGYFQGSGLRLTAYGWIYAKGGSM